MPNLRVVSDADPASAAEVASDLRHREASECDARRRRGPANAGDVIAELLALQPKLSEAEWDARDEAARVAKLARDDAEPRPRAKEPPSRLAELETGGFPRRALLAVARGAPQHPDVRPLARVKHDEFGLLVISGPNGTGKTVASTWLAHERAGESWRFVRAAALLASSRYDRAVRDELLIHPLVIDDLGVDYADAAGSSASDLDDIVSAYYDAMRPLVITTNLLLRARAPDGTTTYPCADRLGPRIADRMREAGVGRWISLTGESKRRRDQPQPKAAT